MRQNDNPFESATVKQPSTLFRVGALAVGLLTIAWMGYAASMITSAPTWLCLLVVSGGAAVIMAVLTIFGVKAFEGESWRRFNLSTLMLVSIPVGVYMAGLRLLLGYLPTDEFTPFIWTLLGVFALLAMAVVTILLTAMAEALFWAARLPLTRKREADAK